jgi:hypothetical protein
VLAFSQNIELFTKRDENETQVPSSKQEENETNWRNREENEANDQKYRVCRRADAGKKTRRNREVNRF